MDTSDYVGQILETVLRDESFLRLVLSDPAPGAPWKKVTVRPVQVHGVRKSQFSLFDGKKDVSKNYNRVGAEEYLLGLVPQYRRFHVQTGQGDLHGRITKKGKVLTTRGKPSRPEATPDLRHNRAKRQPFPADRPDAFLHAIGIMDRHGRVKPSMQGKFRQINEFLKEIEQTLPQDTRPARIVDCGCGSAWLTFAAWRHLTSNMGRDAFVEGVDTNPEVIEKCAALRDRLRWSGLEFKVRAIRDHEPEAPPDFALSLHACDTATDEAIACGVRWGARVILAAPCCQHELAAQINSPVFRPLLRHGILKQRLADLLTDTFRALALRIAGYRTQVIEFVDPEHTAKNLLIRAEKVGKPGDAGAVQEWKGLKAFWGAEPAIEGLLGEMFQKLVEEA